MDLICRNFRGKPFSAHDVYVLPEGPTDLDMYEALDALVLSHSIIHTSDYDPTDHLEMTYAWV